MIREEYRYEKHILDLQTFEGFYNKWCNMRPDYTSDEKCYEALEMRYAYYFGKRKYANYESFRVTIQKKTNDSKNR